MADRPSRIGAPPGIFHGMSTPSGVLHLVRARLDDPPVPRERLADALSAEERARGARFRFDRDRRRHEVGTGLLREALGAVMGVPPGEIAFEVGPHGKPSVPGGPAFNVSHSDEWWLLGMAPEGRVGVDVEVHRPVRELDDLARRTFHPREAAAVLACPAGDARRRAFFRVWSRKEAFIKAVGAGLAYPLDGFVVDAGGAGDRILLEVHDPSDDAGAWHLASVGWAADLDAAVAWDRPGARVEWRPFPAAGA